MLQELLQAFGLIFVAEMGDKTQILSMAFATKYPIKKVFLGILIGSFLNHGLAVLLGSYLSHVLPLLALQITAGFLFVLFGLWSLRSEHETEKKEKERFHFGPILTVSLAFFIGELGDKTQLSAITLASGARYPALILVGTVSGMVATGALGIFVGKKLGDKIPEFAIKIAAALIFLGFGFEKLLTSLPPTYLTLPYVLPFSILIFLIASWSLFSTFKKRKRGLHSKYKVTAQALYRYYAHIEEDLNRICLGPHHCNPCKKNNCIIGQSKEMVADALKQKRNTVHHLLKIQESQNQNFNEDDLIDCLCDTLLFLEKSKDPTALILVGELKEQFEKALFQNALPTYESLEGYMASLQKTNPRIGEKIARQMEVSSASFDAFSS